MSGAQSLRVYLGSGLTVRWPVKRVTEKARLVDTPAGEIWIPTWQWRREVEGLGVSLFAPPSVEAKRRVDGVMAFLARVTGYQQDAAQPVRRAGRGSSDRSVTVKFNVEVDRDGGGFAIYKERTAVVARSLVCTGADGDVTVPRWALNQRLRPGEQLPRGRWPGLANIRAQLEAAVSDVMLQTITGGAK
jgi:hypothetical protein